MGILDTGNNFLSRFRSGTGNNRPPFEPFYAYALTLLIGYAVADLGIIYFRPSMLPREAPPARPLRMDSRQYLTRNDLNSIITRNIFSNDGKIPPPLSAGEKEETNDGPAVLSRLPIKLTGTIVHANPQKSVATINLSSTNETNSFKVNEEIPGMARITKIERRKVTFRNLNNNRLEYIDIPEEGAITFGMKTAPTSGGTGEVAKEGDFDFAVERSIFDKYTSDLSSTLKQARVVPNIVPGTGGQVEGFRFVTIEPDSIYEKLGFKPGDIIKSVNGEPVNSPTKAMELYNMLKSENSVALGIERNGRLENFRYTIK